MSTKHKPRYKRVAQIKTAEDLRGHIAQLGIKLPFDAELVRPSPLAWNYVTNSGKTIGNRFCILPMEGWDGTLDGKPSDKTKRRWNHFAISGAKLLWGCEAVAVQHEGRANPNQLLLNKSNHDEFKNLFDSLRHDHYKRFGTIDDLCIGLQLTHSGRFCKPNDTRRMEPKILYHHPVLNKKFGLPDDYPHMTDDEIDRLIEDFVMAAVRAHQAGFHFVDLKHCHGYLGHEFLTAIDRRGTYGGGFEQRTRFLRAVVEGIRTEAPGLEMGVRLSAFDWIPYRKDETDVGIPEPYQGRYSYAFGGDDSGVGEKLDETFLFMDLLRSLGIQLVCITGGSPYYNPHLTRPALFPPSDGYQPPEDPFVGVARHLNITAEIKRRYPELLIVGSGYSYLQEWLPNVAQHTVRNEMTDFVGLGRMVLSYPELPDDVLNGSPLKRDKICRTFSDCTTAPRKGMFSGCFPLDPYYKQLPEAEKLKELKQ